MSIPALKFYNSLAFILMGCINNSASQPGISWPTSKHLGVYLKDWRALKFVAITFVCVFLTLGTQIHFTDDYCCSVTQSCPTLCDPHDCSIQASLSLTVCWGLPKFMSIASVMPSSQLILSCPFLLPSIFPRDFSSESAVGIR